MPTFEIEMSLAVADYDDDFDLCAESTEDAADSFREFVNELRLSRRLPKDAHVLLLSCEFVEFDSGNPGHANGYFNCRYESPVDLDPLAT